MEKRSAGSAKKTSSESALPQARRSRRQPAQLRSSRVGSKATVIAAANAIAVRALSSRSLSPLVASSFSTSTAKVAEALPRAHRQESSASLHGRGSKRTPPSHARSRHCPVRASTHAQSCRCYSWERHPPRSGPNPWRGRAPPRSDRARATGHGDRGRGDRGLGATRLVRVRVRGLELGLGLGVGLGLRSGLGSHGGWSSSPACAPAVTPRPAPWPWCAPAAAAPSTGRPG
eukprot:scaffold37678_cov65-Phaeocystis_antarctica.AAC.5